MSGFIRAVLQYIPYHRAVLRLEKAGEGFLTPEEIEFINQYKDKNYVRGTNIQHSVENEQKMEKLIQFVHEKVKELGTREDGSPVRRQLTQDEIILLKNAHSAMSEISFLGYIGVNYQKDAAYIGQLDDIFTNCGIRSIVTKK